MLSLQCRKHAINVLFLLLLLLAVLPSPYPFTPCIRRFPSRLLPPGSCWTLVLLSAARDCWLQCAPAAASGKSPSTQANLLWFHSIKSGLTASGCKLGLFLGPSGTINKNSWTLRWGWGYVGADHKDGVRVKIGARLSELSPLSLRKLNDFGQVINLLK